jgi:hypothetical protein
MAARESAPRTAARKSRVSPDDLAHLIHTVAQDGRNLDAWRGELVSACRSSSGGARLMRTGAPASPRAQPVIAISARTSP